jgi:flagellar motor protein MotB
METYDDEQLHAWPAFVDLLAAMTLLFVTLVAVLLYLTHHQQANNHRLQAEARRLRPDTAAEAGDMRTQRQQLIAALRKQQAADSAFRVHEDDPQIVRITLREEATFKRSEYQSRFLNPTGRAALLRIRNVLKDPALVPLYSKVLVVGHTDTAPFPGDDFTNWELSAARAAVVARILVDRQGVDSVGVDPCKVSATGASHYYPAADVPSESSQEERDRLNRRIEIEIIPALVRGYIDDDRCRRATPLP